MRTRQTLYVLIGAAVTGAIALFFVPRGKAEPDAHQLADKIASGTPIRLGGGETLQASSPSAGYFALPVGPQRLAYLDRMIDQQEEMGRKIANGEIKLPPGVGPATHPAGGGADAAGARTSVQTQTSADGSERRVMIRLNADDLSPTLRAQLEEFRGALRARRKERGLDPDAPMMIIRSETRSGTK